MCSLSVILEIGSNILNIKTEQIVYNTDTEAELRKTKPT